MHATKAYEKVRVSSTHF